VEAGASEPDTGRQGVLFDESGPEAELSASDCGDVPARTGADDDDVIGSGVWCAHGGDYRFGRYPLPVTNRLTISAALALSFLAASAASGAPPASPPVLPGPLPGGEIQLPNGRLLTPAGSQTAVLSYPFGLSVTAGGRNVLVASTGASDQALQLLDGGDGRIVASVPVKKSWLGLAVGPGGTVAYLSGANSNAVHLFSVSAGKLAEAGSIPVTTPADGKLDPMPAGITVSANGETLWVARILADDLLRIDIGTKAVTASIPFGPRPYRPVLSPDGSLLAVAAWGGASVALVDSAAGKVIRTIATDDHPCDVVFSPDGKFLYVAQANRNRVAIADVGAGRVVRQVSVALGPEGPGTPSSDVVPDGSTPNALALTPDGRTLFVANADDDAVAVVDLQAGPNGARVTGFIPVGWYPAALALSPDGRTLFVGNGKGSGSRGNALDGPDPMKTGKKQAIGATRNLPGSVSRIAVPGRSELSRHTARAYANRKPAAMGKSPARKSAVVPDGGPASPIRNVIYVIRENRTYDQVFGDVARGNGDASLAIFGRDVTPNAHALADEFVLFDNFYADAEVSADGHNWSMAAYATDFTEKTWVANYSKRGFSYGFEGEDPNASPSAGYLWDSAVRSGLSIRNYGEFIGISPENPAGAFDGRFEGKVPNLRGNTCPFFPGYDADILDNARVDLWLKEFRAYEKKGELPRLMIVRLGNDHTMGTRRGARTPRSMVADNDLAVGRLVEAVSHSKFWKETAVFIVEDDAQNGSDHVDAHRTVALVASPFTRRRGAVDSTLYSTTSMLRTMEMILGLPPLSQHDASATPMTNAFSEVPDLRPYAHRPSNVPLYEMNPDGAPMQVEAETWDLTREDAAPDIALNEAIWKSVRGAASEMPPPVNSAFVRPR
jgi:YVTN family beta-propeller protein